MTDTLRDLVAQLHRPAMPGSLSALAASGEAQFCQECSHIWPCATYRALSASDTQQAQPKMQAQPTREQIEALERQANGLEELWETLGREDCRDDAKHIRELLTIFDAAPRERTLMTADEASAYTRAITADEEPGPAQENDHE